MSGTDISVQLGPDAQEKLRAFFARIDRLEDEKAELTAAIKDVYDEAKGFGFEPKVMKQTRRLQKMSPNEREDLQARVDLYLDVVEQRPADVDSLFS